MWPLAQRPLAACLPCLPPLRPQVGRWVAIGCPFGGAPGYTVDALLTGVQVRGTGCLQCACGAALGARMYFPVAHMLGPADGCFRPCLPLPPPSSMPQFGGSLGQYYFVERATVLQVRRAGRACPYLPACLHG